jgi:hypothetical protein
MHFASVLASTADVAARTYVIAAHRDEEAGVWISSSDIPGLVIEAESENEFRELAAALGPELLRDNGMTGSRRIELHLPGRQPELISA